MGLLRDKNCVPGFSAQIDILSVSPGQEVLKTAAKYEFTLAQALDLEIGVSNR